MPRPLNCQKRPVVLTQRAPPNPLTPVSPAGVPPTLPRRVTTAPHRKLRRPPRSSFSRSENVSKDSTRKWTSMPRNLGWKNQILLVLMGCISTIITQVQTILPDYVFIQWRYLYSGILSNVLSENASQAHTPGTSTSGKTRTSYWTRILTAQGSKPESHGLRDLVWQLRCAEITTTFALLFFQVAHRILGGLRSPSLSIGESKRCRKLKQANSNPRSKEE